MMVIIIPEVDQGLFILFAVIVRVAQVVVERGEIFLSFIFQRLADTQPLPQEDDGAVIKAQLVVDGAEIVIGIDERNCITPFSY